MFIRNNIFILIILKLRKNKTIKSSYLIMPLKSFEELVQKILLGRYKTAFIFKIFSNQGFGFLLPAYGIKK